MSGLKARAAKVAIGGLITLGAAVPVAVASSGPAWAYGPTSKGSSASTVPVTTPSSAAADGVAPSSGSGLAFTGADVSAGLGLAAVAIAGGGTLVVASRRRRSIA